MHRCIGIASLACESHIAVCVSCNFADNNAHAHKAHREYIQSAFEENWQFVNIEMLANVECLPASVCSRSVHMVDANIERI